MGERYIVGLDIGTTKVCVTVGQVRKGQAPVVVGVGLVPSAGMEKGVLLDMGAMADCIRSAIEQAEHSSGINIRAAYVGVAGAHVECHESLGATGIRGSHISEDDVQRVMESASSMCVPLERTVLHVLPIDYIVDGQSGIADPVGMSGLRLEAKVCVVTASLAAVENIARCCEMAGVYVIDTVFEPLASSRSVLRYSELRTAVAVVDIGGGTTDVAIFRNSTLAHASVLPVGGWHFSNDLSIGLRVSTEEAERVKKEHGYAAGNGDGPEEIEVVDGEGKGHKIPRSLLWEIIYPRAEEIFELIRTDIQNVLEFAPTCSVVLTGGTSLLSGLPKVAEAGLGISVRQGMPLDIADPEILDMVESPVCSTAVGLMLYGVEAEQGSYNELIEAVRERLRRLGRGISGLRRKAMGFLLGL